MPVITMPTLKNKTAPGAREGAKMGDRVSARPPAMQPFCYLDRVCLQEILNDFVSETPEHHATLANFKHTKFITVTG